MTMRSMSVALAAALLSTSAIVAPALLSPASAQLGVNINFGAPPAPQYEAVPAPRPGYAWAPGYWNLQNNQHVWAPGHWMEARADQHWTADRWESYREGGQERWRHQPGHWDHDEARVNPPGHMDHDDHRGPAQPAHVDHDDHRGPDHDGRPGDHDGKR